MGNMQADDYANGVREGWGSLQQAVAANLQSKMNGELIITEVMCVEPVSARKEDV